MELLAHRLGWSASSSQPRLASALPRVQTSAPRAVGHTRLRSHLLSKDRVTGLKKCPVVPQQSLSMLSSTGTASLRPTPRFQSHHGGDEGILALPPSQHLARVLHSVSLPAAGDFIYRSTRDGSKSWEVWGKWQSSELHGERQGFWPCG